MPKKYSYKQATKRIEDSRKVTQKVSLPKDFIKAEAERQMLEAAERVKRKGVQ